MPSNDKKNKKRKNSNMTGLVTLIAWALFLTVIINYCLLYTSQLRIDPFRRGMQMTMANAAENCITLFAVSAHGRHGCSPFVHNQ